MRIAVMGTGGVGGYFGGRLAAAGEDVSFIARGAHLEALQQRGLQIRSVLGDATIAPVRASNDPASVGPVDLVLFTVKLYDTETAGEAIRPLIGPETTVVSFQNGITGPEALANKLGAGHVLGGVAKIAAVVAEPGLVRNTGTFAELEFGELDGRRSARVAALAEALGKAGVAHKASDNIRRDIWDKMVFLSTFAGVTSLLRLPIGPIRSDPDSRCLLRDGLAEAHAVAQAEGAGLPDDLADRILERIDALPEEGKASMLHDLEGGRRLEVAWLSGAIARLGRTHGIATPTHELIFRALKPHADGRR